MVKISTDTGMSFLFSTFAIEETAYAYELRYSEILLFLWVHNINQHLIKRPYYDITKTVAILDHIRLELPHKPDTIRNLLHRLHERKLVSKLGDHYTSGGRNPLIYALTNSMSRRTDFFKQLLSKEGGMPKWKHALKKVNKRRQGRVTGYRKRHQKRLLYTCKVPYKSKTDILFK